VAAVCVVCGRAWGARRRHTSVELKIHLEVRWSQFADTELVREVEWVMSMHEWVTARYDTSESCHIWMNELYFKDDWATSCQIRHDEWTMSMSEWVVSHMIRIRHFAYKWMRRTTQMTELRHVTYDKVNVSCLWMNASHHSLCECAMSHLSVWVIPHKWPTGW